MIGKLMKSGEVNGVLVVALSGALSNPIPRREPSVVLSTPAPARRAAA